MTTWKTIHAAAGIIKDHPGRFYGSEDIISRLERGIADGVFRLWQVIASESGVTLCIQFPDGRVVVSQGASLAAAASGLLMGKEG